MYKAILVALLITVLSTSGIYADSSKENSEDTPVIKKRLKLSEKWK